MADTVSQTVLFPDLFDKPLVATFDQQHASSDGGAVLLKAAERQYGLIDGFAECLVDDRQPGKVRHTLADLLGQRIFGIVRRQINPDQWVCFVRETSCRFTVLRGVHRFSRLRCASVLRLTCSRRARIAGRRPA